MTQNITVNKKGFFGPGAFYKSALAIAVPIMLQQLIQSLVSLVDNFMVAGLGDICMSGVNVAGQVLFVFMVFLNAICMSGGIFMTQFFGAKNVGGMQQAFRFKLAMGLAAFIPYYLVCLVFPRQVLSLMLIGNTQAELILDEAVQYADGIHHYDGLVFSPAVETVTKQKADNPKRRLRNARKQTERGGIGTKSQQALQLQREEMKTERRQLSREERNAEALRRFEMKQAKKKEKRRGH